MRALTTLYNDKRLSNKVSSFATMHVNNPTVLELTDGHGQIR